MDHASIVNHFRDCDPTLYPEIVKHIDAVIPMQKSSPETYLRELCESIVSQQLSVKAANTIWARTHAIVNDWNKPDDILGADNKELRACGMSYQKISYVKNIASAAAGGNLRIDKLDSMSNDEVIDELTKIKGVGRWTAEMFLLFTLARIDVFSAGDLGLRNAIDALYGTTKITPVAAAALSLQWTPYRSVASRVLWRTLDTTTT